MNQIPDRKFYFQSGIFTVSKDRNHREPNLIHQTCFGLQFTLSLHKMQNRRYYLLLELLIFTQWIYNRQSSARPRYWNLHISNHRNVPPHSRQSRILLEYSLLVVIFIFGDSRRDIVSMHRKCSYIVLVGCFCLFFFLVD